jgi:hypothetical protein
MTFALAFALVAIIFGAMLWHFQRSLIYFPFGAVPAPLEVGLAGVEAVTIATADGERLQAWFVPADGNAATVVVFNGNAGNRAYRAELAQGLRARGLGVLLFDYRGYGGSTGRPTEQGLAEDARAIRRYLLSRPDVNAARIIYFGESLGAGVAVGLAVESPPAALVMRSPFTSLVDAGKVHYPWLPVGLLLRDRYTSLDRIANVKCPIAVIAGDRDAIIPITQSRALFDAAREPQTLTVIKGADHNDADLVHGPQVLEAVLRAASSRGRAR